MNVNIMVGFVG